MNRRENFFNPMRFSHKHLNKKRRIFLDDNCDDDYDDKNNIQQQLLINFMSED